MLRAGGEATFNLGGGGLYGIAQLLADSADLGRQ